MSQIARLTRLSLVLAIFTAGAAAAQPATQGPAAATPEPPPVAVAQDAPKGTSGDVAMGAAVGLIGGLVVLLLIVGSGG